MALDLKRLRAAEAASDLLAAADERRRLVAQLYKMAELLPPPGRDELLGLLLEISDADEQGQLTRPAFARLAAKIEELETERTGLYYLRNILSHELSKRLEWEELTK